MGNGVNVFLFCLAIDPLLWALCSVPSLFLPSGYVDDLSAGAATRRATRLFMCLIKAYSSCSNLKVAYVCRRLYGVRFSPLLL